MHVDWQQPVNWDCSLTRGLVSWWMVGENPYFGGGVFRDLCNRYHGTLTGMDPATAWKGSLGRPGGFGCLDFDGSNDWVNCGDVPTDDLSSMSFGIWVYAPTSWDDQVGIVAKSQAVDTNNSFWWNVRSTGAIHVCINNAVDGGGNFGWSGAVVANTWRHLCMVFDGNESSGNRVRKYTNGSLAQTSSHTATSILATSVVMSLGALNQGSQGRWPGRLDDAMLFNRALSASGVSALYNDSRRGHPEMLNRIRPTWYVDQAGGGGGGLAIPVARHHYVMQGAA